MRTNEIQLLFNGKDLSQYLFVDKITKFVAPKRKIQQFDAFYGAHIKSWGFSPITIKVSATILEQRASAIARVRKMLAQALVTETPRKLVLPDDRENYYYAIYTGGVEVEVFTPYPDVALEFLAPDPIAYGAHHKEEFGKRAQVFTGGTYKTRPRIFVTPSAGTTYWEARNYTTGKYVGVHANFDGNSQLVIDMQLERTTINRHDIAVDLNSDFFSMSTGDVLMATSSYTIEWEERFI